MLDSRRSRIALLAYLACPAGMAAQTPPLITDRPDFTESPFVVPPGALQIEAGLTWQPARYLSQVSGPEALLRWSPAKRFEVRVEPPGYVHGDSLRGVTDAGLGMKIEVGRFRGWSVGAIGSLGLPIGDAEVSAGRLVPEVILTAGRGLGDAWTLGTQASAARAEAGEGVVLAATIVTGRTLTPRLGAFFEVAAEREPGASVSTWLHAGLAYLVSPTLQLDVHAAPAITGEGATTAVGFGVSTRFD